MFADLSLPAPDPLLGLKELFAADQSPLKVDLSIGVYRDNHGNVAILDCVKDVEASLVRDQGTKNYLSSSGNAVYNELTRGLVLGQGEDWRARGRTTQTPGGTGALRVAAEFIKSLRPGARVFVSSPTWANHHPILKAVGLETVVYPYYDVATGRLLFDEMMEAIKSARAGDVVLIHACCHNPSNADLDIAQWQEVACLLSRTGATPLVDMAYQGFGSGLDADAAGVRLLADQLPEMLVASSYSKNFALYRERVGALTLVAANDSAATRALGHLMPIIRANYSMPPDHGAAVVAHVLSDAERRKGWEVELTGMRNRIAAIREGFTAALNASSNRDFSYFSSQRGMFALFDISPEAVVGLREKDHVHMSGSGRMNIAGLKASDVERVAQAVGAALR